jgi:hypothetical protein
MTRLLTPRSIAASLSLLAGLAAPALPGGDAIFGGKAWAQQMVSPIQVKDCGTTAVKSIDALGALTCVPDTGVLLQNGKIYAPSWTAGPAVGFESEAVVWLNSVTDATTRARYGGLGVMTYQPPGSGPWGSTIEALIGLAYMQGINGTHSDYVMGIGGTAFLCDPSIAPQCPGTSVTNSSGVLTGAYGSAEMNGLGNAAWLTGVWADGSNNIVHSGTVSNNAAAYLTPPQGGAKRYGAYFAGGVSPPDGTMASPGDMSLRPGNVNAVVVWNTGTTCGSEFYTTNNGAVYTGLGTTCSITIAPTGSGLVYAGGTANGSFGLRYASGTPAVPANFVANKYVLLQMNGVYHYIPAMTASW